MLQNNVIYLWPKGFYGQMALKFVLKLFTLIKLTSIKLFNIYFDKVEVLASSLTNSKS